MPGGGILNHPPSQWTPPGRELAHRLEPSAQRGIDLLTGNREGPGFPAGARVVGGT